MSIDTATGKVINGPTRKQLSVTYDPNNNESAPLHALDVWKYVKKGTDCPLPDKVDILLENGFRRVAEVTWQSVADASAEGVYTVSGTATYKGETYPVTAHITVA